MDQPANTGGYRVQVLKANAEYKALNAERTIIDPCVLH